MTKTIFITGTSTGLGKATAIHFAKEGWNVAATMRSPEKAKDFSSYENIKVFKLDVTDPAEVARAIEEATTAFGKIDVVVNNAGQGTYGALELLTEDAIDAQYQVNVRGPINVTKAFLPHFRANKGGKFINISSYMGLFAAVPLGSMYNMSKFALEGFTEGLYFELKPLNIDLHLLEIGGFKGNNFVDNVTWGENSDIAEYKEVTAMLQGLMGKRDPSLLSEPQLIVDEIFALATGANKKFRNLVGEDTKALQSMRDSLPVEEFLEKIDAMYK
jgi:NAD(P)-dependent dehydrogenase (short-subunit alcohol dehydrogenase family)